MIGYPSGRDGGILAAQDYLLYPAGKIPQRRYNIFLMSRTIEMTTFMWEKGRGDKRCPGPESCLPRARPVLGASVSEWHIRPWDGCHGAQRQGGVYLCQAPGGMVARGSGCAHRFSPKLRQPRHHFSVGLKGCRQQHLSPKPFIKKKQQNVIQKETVCFKL